MYEIEQIIYTEQWKVVEGFEEYLASSEGNVINTKTDKAPPVWETKKGYRMVFLQSSERQEWVKLHQLIAHTFISNTQGLRCVDHINGDPRDNSVSNLRWCTHQHNSQNKAKKNGTSSQYKGVCYHKREKKWRAQIEYDWKVVYLGCFEDEKAAARADNAKANEIFGEFAKLNIIN